MIIRGNTIAERKVSYHCCIRLVVAQLLAAAVKLRDFVSQDATRLSGQDTSKTVAAVWRNPAGVFNKLPVVG